MPKLINPIYILIFGACIAAIAIQNRLAIHSDVSYLLFVSNQLFHGKKYGIDIFETNPPMILYLYYPAIKIQQITGISLTDSLHMWVFSLALTSLIICTNLLARLVSDKLTIYLLTLTMLFIMLFLPANQFGQREHISLILTLPYFFSAALALEKKSINKFLLVSIGILAGIGFSIKPYFIFPFIFIELYLKSWLRIPPIIISAIIVAYIISTMILQPGYFNIVLPLVNDFYFYGIEESWAEILSPLYVTFCLSMFVTSLLLYRKLKYRNLLLILIIALGGSIVSFITTKTSWFYHLIPTIGLGCLVATLLASHLFISHTKDNITFIRRSYYLTATCLATIFILFNPIATATVITEAHLRDHNNPDYFALINYIKSSKSPRTITCFSMNTTEDCFPLATDSQSVYTSRYPFFWWIRGAIKLERQKPVSFALVKPEVKKLTKFVVDDIEKHKTHWVIVNNADANHITGVNFDFFYYLSRHYADFRRITLKYSKPKQIGIYSIYEHI